MILRSVLDEITSSGKSLMADGMENELSHQDLADVIAYLRSPDTNPAATPPAAAAADGTTQPGTGESH